MTASAPMTARAICPMTVREKTKDFNSTHREALIMQHLPLVRVIALHVLRTVPKHVDVEDLEQAGTIGLLAAADRFDASKDVTFGGYAKHRIRGAMLDTLRQADPMSRDLRREKKKIEAAANNLEQRLSREATELELAQVLNMELARLREIRLQLFNAQCLPMANRADDDSPVAEAVSEADLPDSILLRRQMKGIVVDAIAELPERWRDVLRMYYAEELTMQEIGRVLGVNESRVSQIHKSAVKALGEQLRSRGVSSAAA